MSNNQSATQGFLRLPAVLSLIPVSKSTWWAGIQANRFPRPIKLGPRTTAWRAEDIAALIEKMGSQTNVGR
jgi:predicted DNA-binding transcriptional regulator AlpA